MSGTKTGDKATKPKVKMESLLLTEELDAVMERILSGIKPDKGDTKKDSDPLDAGNRSHLFNTHL